MKNRDEDIALPVNLQCYKTGNEPMVSFNQQTVKF